MKKRCRSVDVAEIACEAGREIRVVNLLPDSLYKRASLIVLLAVFTVSPQAAKATQADDTTITITGQTPGSVPFLSQLTLIASDTSVIKDVQFTISPKPGSVTRPLSGTFSNDYLVEQGYLVPSQGEIFCRFTDSTMATQIPSP